MLVYTSELIESGRDELFKIEAHGERDVLSTGRSRLRGVGAPPTGRKWTAPGTFAEER